MISCPVCTREAASESPTTDHHVVYHHGSQDYCIKCLHRHGKCDWCKNQQQVRPKDFSKEAVSKFIDKVNDMCKVYGERTWWEDLDPLAFENKVGEMTKELFMLSLRAPDQMTMTFCEVKMRDFTMRANYIREHPFSSGGRKNDG